MNDLKDLIEAIEQDDPDRIRAIVEINREVLNQEDEHGATALHYAAMKGNRQTVSLLFERGADINKTDAEYGATPAGWAIEYLRELGAHLAIELNDLAYAIKEKDVRWVARFLKRFPDLLNAAHTNGKTFRELAHESGSAEIIKLFGLEE